jgi:hypothetical protein
VTARDKAVWRGELQFEHEKLAQQSLERLSNNGHNGKEKERINISFKRKKKERKKEEEEEEERKKERKKEEEEEEEEEEERRRRKKEEEGKKKKERRRRRKELAVTWPVLTLHCDNIIGQCCPHILGQLVGANN